MFYAITGHLYPHLANVVVVVCRNHVARTVPVGVLQVVVVALVADAIYDSGVFFGVGHGDKGIFAIVQVQADATVGEFAHRVASQAIAGIVEDVEVYVLNVFLYHAHVAIGHVFQVYDGVVAVATVFANAGGEQQEEQSQDPPQPSLKGREQ